MLCADRQQTRLASAVEVATPKTYREQGAGLPRSEAAHEGQRRRHPRVGRHRVDVRTHLIDTAEQANTFMPR